jgi:hypothetical protein
MDQMARDDCLLGERQSIQPIAQRGGDETDRHRRDENSDAASVQKQTLR